MQPQHTVVASPVVVQPAYVNQPYVTASVVHSYLDRQSLIIGILLIIAGSLSIVFNIVQLTELYSGWGYVGHGIWCGIMIIIVGGFGIGAARHKTRCMINAFLSLAIIGAIFAAVQLLVASVAAAFWNFVEHDTVYVMEVLLALLGAIEFALCLWGSILCCATGESCGSSQPTVFAAPVQPQVTVVTLQQQQQPMQPHPMVQPPAYQQPVIYPGSPQYPGYAPTAGYEPK